LFKTILTEKSSLYTQSRYSKLWGLSVCEKMKEFAMLVEFKWKKFWYNFRLFFHHLSQLYLNLLYLTNIRYKIGLKVYLWFQTFTISKKQRVSIYFFTVTFYFQKAIHRECEIYKIYNDVNFEKKNKRLRPFWPVFL